ncbi:unnamed protein product (macronuclear) [Paramecium tetraurelia]|uniref:Uncharacterized protein n=1 Tax=Paramecium tetraurelia TaxID=5888 RepID=A0BH98_PARTE|nr:uncharacterized protein GSPATT00028950001 [Paramecium tetraurelia]CAK57915.1 unnamed protein product [Paramecium tetraurelia]|eukprot:XP_001425313.1 hypothetical protein (macronuclear) [Paramecium tetraurelia strain d4-2]
MQRRQDSNNNRIRICIDRSVEVRNTRQNLSPLQSNHLISPQIYKHLKLPSIKQSRSPSATNQKNNAKNVSVLNQQTTELIKKLSYNSVKYKHHRFITENKRKSSLSQNKLEPQTKLTSKYKRTRSISNMVSKNSLIVSTQFEEEEELSNQIKLHTNLPQNQIKIEIIDKVQSNYEQSQNRYAKFKAQQQQLQNESYQKSDNQELNSLRQSLFSIIENSRVQRHKFYQFGNTDQQLQLLEKLYLQNEKLVKNYVQIRQEAQQLDQKVKSLSNQRKQFRIQ